VIITYDEQHAAAYSGMGILPTRDELRQILTESGFKRMWNDPFSGKQYYEVERMPEHKHFTGVRWIEVKP